MLSGEIEVLLGWDALSARTGEIEALHHAIGTPVDARLPWLGVWAEVHPDRTITTLATRDATGTVDALAPVPTQSLAAWSAGPVRSAWRTGLDVTRRARELRDRGGSGARTRP